VAEIVYTESYLRRATAFFHLHPNLIRVYEKTLKLLELNPHHPSLRLHKLKGKSEPLYSVSINLKYRIILVFIIDKDRVIPVTIGTHDQVY
jgi:toxin HigB-1